MKKIKLQAIKSVAGVIFLAFGLFAMLTVCALIDPTCTWPWPLYVALAAGSIAICNVSWDVFSEADERLNGGENERV